MLEKRLHLTVVNPQNPLTVGSGKTVSVDVRIEGENLEAGVVTLDVDSPSIAVLSPGEVPLPAGSYSKTVNWSLGGHEMTRRRQAEQRLCESLLALVPSFDWWSFA